MRYGTPKRRPQRDDGGDVLRSLVRNRTGDNATQAVTDHVNFSPRLLASLVNRLRQTTLDQQVGTLRIEPDSREIWLIADASEPGIQFHHVDVGAEEAGNDDNTGAVSAGHAKAVIDRSGVQQQKFGGKEGFRPR